MRTRPRGLEVLTLGTSPWAVESAADALITAGHRVVRCADPGEREFPCNGLRGDLAAPWTPTRVPMSCSWSELACTPDPRRPSSVSRVVSAGPSHSWWPDYPTASGAAARGALIPSRSRCLVRCQHSDDYCFQIL